MSERLTAAFVPGARSSGVAQTGRKTRTEMIEYYRDHYRNELVKAQEALAATDDEIVVETYIGVWAQNKRQVVTD